MIKEISSVQNILVKRLISLTQKSRNRKKEGLFVIEGIREVERAINSGYQVKEIVFSSEWGKVEIEEFINNRAFDAYQFSKDAFEKVAYRGRVKNIIATCIPQNTEIASLQLPDNALVIVLETVEKPGNLGAVLRSANGAGVNVVIVCDQEMDVYNPNVIRNSLGGFFDIELVQCASDAAIEFLKANQLQIITTYLEASIPYHEIDMKKGTAIVLGSESQGVTDIWLEASSQNVIIPMEGIVDSLNVSNAASIMMFEAARQRKY